MDYEDLDQYNGDTIHDMYVDSDYEINIGEPSQSVRRSRLR